MRFNICIKTKVSLLLLTLFIGAGMFGMNVIPVQAASLAELQQYIEQLKSQIAELQAKLRLAQQRQSTEWCHTFNKNLKIGDTGTEVIALHKALEKAGFGPFDRGGDDFNAFNIFTEATASAVVGFQEKYSNEILSPYGLSHGTGFVGKTTRAKLNQLYGCGTTQPVIETIPVVKDKPYCGAIGSKSEGWYQNGKLIKWDNCEECYAVCKFIGTRSEGWYSVCKAGLMDNKLIEYADCGEQQEEPYIKVTSPNGGEKWVEGGTYKIAWTAKGITENVEIYIRDDRAGPAYKLIASEISPALREYSWNIPIDFWGEYTSGGYYKIQVREIRGMAGGGPGEGIFDESDNYFSIVEQENWQVYENQEYKYSFEYPNGCFYGPMAVYCKDNPISERPSECLCFLNGQDDDSVFMQKYVGDDLALATIYISRYNVGVYDPQPGANLTDFIEWHIEEFPSLDFSNRTDMEIGGVPAVKIYTPFSGMAYSSEDIYFIKDDKLFRINMVDVGNEDIKELYDRMLSTFEFFE